MSHDTLDSPDFESGPSDEQDDDTPPGGSVLLFKQRESVDPDAETRTDPDPIENDDVDTVPVPVDPPGRERPTWNESVRGEQRRDVLPSWLRSREALREQARWVFDHYRHVFAFHAVRTPVYAGTLAVRSPLGAVRLVGR
ncbi:hypothetical protein GT354_52170, partial [Streptomyces sp. SID3343]|nr:hypothetical protein [Streptomyces sp. SID3343]